MNRIDSLKQRIKVVEKEIKRENVKSKKIRLNKYKQKLEIELRDLISNNRGVVNG